MEIIVSPGVLDPYTLTDSECFAILAHLGVSIEQEPGAPDLRCLHQGEFPGEFRNCYYATCLQDAVYIACGRSCIEQITIESIEAMEVAA